MFDSDRKLYINVSDDILCELGKIVVFQNCLEWQISSNIISLLEVDNEKGNIITAELSFRQLIGVLSSLLLSKLGKDSSLYSEFEEIKKELYTFENFRNTIAHSVWASTGSENSKAQRMKITAKEKQGLKYSNDEVTLNSIIERLENAGDTQVKLACFMSKITGCPI